jgi:hypothetical protein
MFLYVMPAKFGGAHPLSVVKALSSFHSWAKADRQAGRDK